MMPDIKIIVCYHKPGKYISNEVYVPVHVGKATSKYNLPIQGDNEGENISSLNYTYCELTGLYWAWKNIKADYIGLCHYRRFFTFKNSSFCCAVHGIYTRIRNVAESFSRFPKSFSNINEVIVKDEQDLIRKVFKDSDKIKEYLGKHPDIKIIALTPINIGLNNNKTFFSMVAGRHHVEIVKNIVQSKYPSISPFLEFTLSSNLLHLGNMTICHNSVFNDYCNFLFSVLETYRKTLIDEGWYIDYSEKSISRVSGYMAEILTSVFINYIQAKEGKKSIKLLPLLRVV